MKHSTPTLLRLRTLASRVHFRSVHTNFKPFKTVSHTSNLLVNRQVVLTTGTRATYVECLRNLVFVLCFSHVPSFGLGLIDSSNMSSATVNALVKRHPHAVRRADFRCPDFNAMEVPPNTLHAGAFIRCEDWNEYHDLMRTGRTSEAEKILVAPPGTSDRLHELKLKRDSKEN